MHPGQNPSTSRLTGVALCADDASLRNARRTITKPANPWDWAYAAIYLKLVCRATPMSRTVALKAAAVHARAHTHAAYILNRPSTPKHLHIRSTTLNLSPLLRFGSSTILRSAKNPSLLLPPNPAAQVRIPVTDTMRRPRSRDERSSECLGAERRMRSISLVPSAYLCFASIGEGTPDEVGHGASGKRRGRIYRRPL